MGSGKLDCALHTSRSWKGEDFALLPLLLRVAGSRPGRFVELGAYTGNDFSNTLVLERCFGWRGLLIEANSENFAQLEHSGRSALLRHSAICAGQGKRGQTTNITKVGGAVAGQVGTMSAQFVATQRRGDDLTQEAVPCQSLTSLVKQSSVTLPIDFLSLGAWRRRACACSHSLGSFLHSLRQMSRARSTRCSSIPMHECSPSYSSRRRAVASGRTKPFTAYYCQVDWCFQMRSKCLQAAFT